MRLFRRKTRFNVIELHGTIAPKAGNLNAEGMAETIADAFESANGRPVILDIESPGGSPVQSDLIATMIRRHADKHQVRVHAVVGEVAASGGYWLACAADEIHANPMSIVGSIGVRGGGFGFPRVLERLGVEYRSYKAGENKTRFDPFTPERPEDVAFAADLMGALHERFKDWVRTRRGARLKADESALFDGGFMLGERALAVGLIDGLNDVDSLVRLIGGEKATTKRFEQRKKGLLGRIPGLAMDSMLDAVEARRWRADFR